MRRIFNNSSKITSMWYQNLINMHNLKNIRHKTRNLSRFQGFQGFFWNFGIFSLYFQIIIQIRDDGLLFHSRNIKFFQIKSYRPRLLFFFSSCQNFKFPTKKKKKKKVTYRDFFKPPKTIFLAEEGIFDNLCWQLLGKDI